MKKIFMAAMFAFVPVSAIADTVKPGMDMETAADRCVFEKIREAAAYAAFMKANTDSSTDVRITLDISDVKRNCETSTKTKVVTAKALTYVPLS